MGNNARDKPFAWAYVSSREPWNQPLVNVSDNSTMDVQAETPGCPYQEPFWPQLGIFLTLVDSVVSMLALLGNGLVIVSVLKYPSLRSATNMFVVSLAVADLLVGVCIPYYVLFYFDLDWICSYWPCLVRYFTVLCSTVASMLSNVGVAVDRYLAILHPLAYPRLIGRWRVPTVLALGWLYVVVITALPLFGVNIWTASKMDKCQRHLIECDLFYMATVEYVMLAVGSHVLLTLVVTVSLYLRIFREAWRQQRCVAVFEAHPRLRHEARTARVMALVLGVCFLGLAPYLVAIVLPYAFQSAMCHDHSWRVYKKLAVCFYLGKSSLNPLIYGWKNTEFRHAFCRLLRLPCPSLKERRHSPVQVFSITKLP